MKPLEGGNMAMTQSNWGNKFRAVWIIGVVLWAACHSFAKDPIVIGDLKVSPGEMGAGYLVVPAKKDPGCSIPVTVINGAKEGKILALIAAVHGYEFTPILSLYRLKSMIDPQKLAGTLVLVHIANLPGFQKRTIGGYNPLDGKDLNRVFPGDPNGTTTQRIAYVLTEEVVKKCDALVDLHCGDGNEDVIPQCYWMLSGDEKLDKISRDMVLAFGIKHNIIVKSPTKDIAQSKMLMLAAVLLSKPAFASESSLGRTDEEDILGNLTGIMSVMRYFRMVEGEASFVAEPVWIDELETISSEVDGLFYPQTKVGSYLSKGEKFGTMTDYLGNVIREFRSPLTGIVMLIINTPSANAGDLLFVVGTIKRD